MDASVGGQAHEVDFLAALLDITEDGFYLGIIENTAVLARTVNLDKVLIHHASGTDIEMPDLGVTHLSVRQTYVLAARLQLGIRIGFQQFVPVWRRGTMDGICGIFVTDTPAVQNH